MPEIAGKANAALDPQQLLQMSMSFTTARILSAAVRLDVFSPLASGPKTAAAVARAAGASERGTRMLLDALTALQLLTKSGGNYGLTPATAQYLLRESRDYMGAVIADETLWEVWGKLDEAIRTGRPPRRVESQAAAEKFFPL